MGRAFTAVVIELPDDDGVVRIRKTEVPASDGGSLAFLQKSVGGYIEHLVSEDGTVDFWMNEEGKLVGLPINEAATSLLYALHPAFRGYDVLVGNVVLTGNDGPETTSIPEGFWTKLKGLPWRYTIEFIENGAEL